MEKTNLESLLSACYELEGLIMIALDRGAETPGHVYASIETKIETLKQIYKYENKAIPETKPQENITEEIADAVEYEENSDADIPVSTATASDSKQIVSHAKFSINDRYQFIRELFNGNEAEFKDAIAILEEMGTPDEMEDYLYNDLCLNEQDPTVAHFISILMKSKNNE